MRDIDLRLKRIENALALQSVDHPILVVAFWDKNGKRAAARAEWDGHACHRNGGEDQPAFEDRALALVETHKRKRGPTVVVFSRGSESEPRRIVPLLAADD